MGYAVFVSYSTRDLATANTLKGWMEHAGADVFVAEYAVGPGSPLAAGIEEAIRGCQLFLLLWSTNARASDWVPQEIGIAKGAQRPILPVVLHSGIELPGFVRDLKYLPLYGDPQGAVRRLYDDVKERVGAKAKADQRDRWVTALVVAALVYVVLAGEQA